MRTDGPWEVVPGDGAQRMIRVVGTKFKIIALTAQGNDEPNAAFIVEACNNYESVCAERDRLLAESEETECLQGEQDKFAREANEQIAALKLERDRLKAALEGIVREWYERRIFTPPSAALKYAIETARAALQGDGR